jgi:Tol biopolymer transport system component
VPAPLVARRKNRERLAWVVAALALLAALGLAFIHFKAPSDTRVVRSNILPPENNAFSGGIVSGGYTISRDGSRLAFVAQSVDGKTSLWVRSLDSLSAQVLVGTDNASLPFWSPDGQWIGFFSEGKLKKSLASGGSVQEICDASLGRGGTWNAQGTIIFSPSIGSPLFRVSANGGVPVALTKLDTSRGETTHRWPDFLPDGVHFLYLGRNLSSEKTSALYVGSLDGSPAKRIMDVGGGARYAWPGYILFVRNAILLAQQFDSRKLSLLGDPVPIATGVSNQPFVLRASFDVSQNGEVVYQGFNGSGDSELMVTDRSGKNLAVLGTTGNYVAIRVSPDSQRVAVVDQNPISNDSVIWMYDLKRNVKTRFSFGSGLSGNPVWSPDGSQLAFSSTQTGIANIYVKPANGATEETALEKSGDDHRPKSWSPDGRYLAFENRAPGVPAVFILPLFGDRKPFSLLNASYPTYLPQFSPDGHWIAYVSFESGRPEVYVTSFPGAKGKWQVSTAGGSSPQWRHDGRELFYIAPNGALMAAEVSTVSDSVSTGAVQQLSERRVTQNNSVSVYDVFPDGQRFIISAVKPEAMHTPLTLVTNWPTALPR